MTKITVIRKASPNRFPIRLIQDIGYDGVPFFVVECKDPEGYWEYSDEGFGTGFDTREEAERHFDEWVKELSGTPNWDAQEEYDRVHGTINGYAPWQCEDREY